MSIWLAPVETLRLLKTLRLKESSSAPLTEKLTPGATTTAWNATAEGGDMLEAAMTPCAWPLKTIVCAGAAVSKRLVFTTQRPQACSLDGAIRAAALPSDDSIARTEGTAMAAGRPESRAGQLTLVLQLRNASAAPLTTTVLPSVQKLTLSPANWTPLALGVRFSTCSLLSLLVRILALSGLSESYDIMK